MPSNMKIKNNDPNSMEANIPKETPIGSSSSTINVLKVEVEISEKLFDELYKLFVIVT